VSGRAFPSKPGKGKVKKKLGGWLPLVGGSKSKIQELDERVKNEVTNKIGGHKAGWFIKVQR